MAPIEPPSWLNDEFLQKALISGRKDKSISVISSEVSRAAAEGDHYGSEMYRVSIKLKSSAGEENVCVIVKTTHANKEAEVTKILEKSDTFLKEINSFSIAIPAMQDLLNNATPGGSSPFVAEHIYSNLETPASVIVLEDLKKSGFTLAEPTIGLDLQHCLLVLRTIARYHGASMVLHERHPEHFTAFNETFYCGEQRSVIKFFFATAMKSCANEIEKWPALNGKYAEELHRIADDVVEIVSSQFKRDESGFNVLIHGDLWKNNIMFKYSEETGEVLEARFVDFQGSYWTSPALDLMYFLNTSASPDVMRQFDVLIKVYHNSLCKTLSLLGYEHLKPSLEVVNKEIDQKGLFGIISATSVRVVALVDRTQIPDINDIIGGRQTEMNLSEEYKVSLKHLLPFYEKRGWLSI